MIEELQGADLFQEWFGIYCVDEGEVPGRFGRVPSDRIELAYGRRDLWPVADHYEDWDEASLFDAVELYGALASVGIEETGSFHSYNDCGWHFTEFDHAVGLARYRGAVDPLLRRYGSGYRLNEEGQVQRLLPPETTGLVATDPEAAPLSEESLISAAIDGFQQPRPESQREALKLLADVLEGRRAEIRNLLGREHEGALFEIANRFWIRHNNPQQQRDYDHEIWWDWLFSLYLSSIRLVQALSDRAEGTSGAVAELVSDLSGQSPMSFYRGDLTRRLASLELSTLPQGALRRLGVAVGRRAATGTGTVTLEGVVECAESGDLGRWPAAFRVGLVEGSFLTSDGQLAGRAFSSRAAVHAAIDHVERSELLALLRDIEESTPSYRFVQNQAEVAQLAGAVNEEAKLFVDPDLKAAWNRIAARLRNYLSG